MRHCIQVAGLLVAFVFAGETLGQNVGEVVHVQMQTGTTVVGECLEIDAGGMRLFALKMRREMRIETNSISVQRVLRSDDDIVEAVGVFPFLIWKAERCLSGLEDGRVASITPSQVILATDDSRGVRVGDRLIVMRDGDEVVDPTTQQAVGRLRSRICELEATAVEAQLITARIIPESGVDPVIGDIVLDTFIDRPTAVLPLQCSMSPELGSELQVKLTSLLGDAGFRLVERQALDQAITELALQQSAAFDQRTAQRVGDLVGAYAVLVGDVIPSDQKTELHLRLVHVRTGEVLMTCVGSVANRELASLTTLLEERKQELRDRIVGSKWRWTYDPDPNAGIFTYHEDGSVTCTNWDGKPGYWRVLDTETIFQVDSNESNRWRITFSDDFRVATWTHVRTRETVVCPAVD